MATQTTNALPPIAGIVIAGGRSHRLGTDKRKLRLWGDAGPTLLEHTISILRELCTEMIVVLNDPVDWQHLSVHPVRDRYADAGVLGGIYSGLAAMSATHAMVVAADMPFLNRELLRAMMSLPRDYDVLVPRALQPDQTRNTPGLETLHAIYSATCLTTIQTLLNQGNRRVTTVFSQVRTVILEPNDLIPHDPLSFVNINTAEDLTTVQAYLKTKQNRT
ncbi:MAG: molybdenum cofactor guanylyltransferase [Chloroflexi bacterium AL-W]|nr:molybdenum cofactor guanylyltransferase [Chloroflexi bacterium AL-N1]NOK69553.1 molybdenum cofactor guanylyltransferase [Chloroflexi bacterium AL-N10]NOK77518.1 molybdenum cofactor guanylyltransferase [Chloroflexi bacterium AL-N5]NOK84369.1 molybdenum cofactor guanylyltransferase [Chloroflexi bacterium AL-W]NOK91465.1 molybdenum cofactor guanylyltransferase [Chloroflexi bacterium AL-N15]